MILNRHKTGHSSSSGFTFASARTILKCGNLPAAYNDKMMQAFIGIRWNGMVYGTDSGRKQLQRRYIGSEIAIIGRLFFSITLFLAASGWSANVCIGPSATGNGSGADWNNIKAITATPTRGDVWYLSDGAYGSRTWSTANSGQTVCTIKKATIADHGTATGWVNALGAGQATFTDISFTTSHWLLDFQTGGGPGSWESGFGGFMQMPTSGSQSAGFTFSSGITNITIKHMDVHCGGRTRASDADAFYIVNPLNGLTISYCFLHDSSRTFILTWPASCNGITVEYTKMARNGTAEHREAWSFGTDKNVIVRYNLFEDIFGTGVLCGVNNTGDALNWDIYGNVFYWTGNYHDAILNTGILLTGDGTPSFAIRANNWHVYNNVIANNISQSFTSQFVFQLTPINVVVENNIWYNNHTDSGASGTTTEDYNWYYANNSNGTVGSHDVVGTSNPFVSATPWTDGNWQLKAAIAGLALSAPYNIDPVGAARGADGVFDRGAYEFGSGNTNPVIVVSPGSLSFGSTPTNTTKDLTISVQNTGGGTLAGTASVAAPFSIVSGKTYNLGAGQSQIVSVRYNPTNLGNFSQSVIFTGGGGATATVSGSSTVALAPPTNLKVVLNP